MAELLKKEKELVVPGDEIIRSMDFLPGRNAFREGDSIVAKRLGIISISGRVISVVPVSGVYLPKAGDMVIGQVDEVQSNGWVLDIKSISPAYLPISGIREYIDTTKTDLSKVFGVGDLIYAKISMANPSTIHLTMQDSRARKIRSGRTISMSPAKIPRLIGREGSMINMIKDKTACRINAGQNGIIWIEGEKEDLLIEAVRLIEKESASDGLTDRVAALLDGHSKEVEK